MTVMKTEYHVAEKLSLKCMKLKRKNDGHSKYIKNVISLRYFS